VRWGLCSKGVWGSFAIVVRWVELVGRRKKERKGGRFESLWGGVGLVGVI